MGCLPPSAADSSRPIMIRYYRKNVQFASERDECVIYRPNDHCYSSPHVGLLFYCAGLADRLVEGDTSHTSRLRPASDVPSFFHDRHWFRSPDSPTPPLLFGCCVVLNLISPSHRRSNFTPPKEQKTRLHGQNYDPYPPPYRQKSLHHNVWLLFGSFWVEVASISSWWEATPSIASSSSIDNWDMLADGPDKTINCCCLDRRRGCVKIERPVSQRGPTTSRARKNTVHTPEQGADTSHTHRIFSREASVSSNR